MTFEGWFSPFTLWGWTQAWWKTLLVAEPSRQSPLWIHKNREPALMLLWFTLELNLVMCLYYPGVGDNQMAYWGDSFFPFLLKGIFRNLRRVESSEELWGDGLRVGADLVPSTCVRRSQPRTLSVAEGPAACCLLLWVPGHSHTNPHGHRNVHKPKSDLQKNLKWKTMRTESARAALGLFLPPLLRIWRPAVPHWALPQLSRERNIRTRVCN